LITSKFIIPSWSHSLVFFPCIPRDTTILMFDEGANHTWHYCFVTYRPSLHIDSIQNLSGSYKGESLHNSDEILRSGWAAITEWNLICFPQTSACALGHKPFYNLLSINLCTLEHRPVIFAWYIVITLILGFTSVSCNNNDITVVIDYNYNFAANKQKFINFAWFN